jgi:hypothetical protein
MPMNRKTPCALFCVRTWYTGRLFRRDGCKQHLTPLASWTAISTVRNFTW